MNVKLEAFGDISNCQELQRHLLITIERARRAADALVGVVVRRVSGIRLNRSLIRLSVNGCSAAAVELSCGARTLTRRLVGAGFVIGMNARVLLLQEFVQFQNQLVELQGVFFFCNAPAQVFQALPFFGGHLSAS